MAEAKLPSMGEPRGSAVSAQYTAATPVFPARSLCLFRSCSLDPLPGGNSGKAEADAEAPARRRARAAERRPADGADIVPAAAPAGADRAAFPGIGAPLPHVALHVAQTQPVRRVGANPRRPP